MANYLEDILYEKGLKKISSLSEIIALPSFLVDSNISNTTTLYSEVFPVYPVITNKANLTHDLLNLYGVHWRYQVNIKDWENIKIQDGDAQVVLSEYLQGKRTYRHAVFAFSQKYLDRFKSLWIFSPDTPGWDYYTNILLPRFNEDMANYKNLKQGAG